MPYEIKASGVGAWQQGDRVEDADWNAYPHREKALAKGYAVQADTNARAADPAAQQQQVAELNAQIAQLTGQRDALLGLNQEPHAPAAVAIDVDRNDQPSRAEADTIRREGREVVQPTPAELNQGELVPGEAADADKPKGRERK